MALERKVDLGQVKRGRELDLPDWGVWSGRYVGGALIADPDRSIVMEFPFAVRTIGYPLIVAGPRYEEDGYLRQWRTDEALTLWQWRLLQATMAGETSRPEDGGGIIEYVPVSDDVLVASARFFKRTAGVSQRYIFDFCAGQAPIRARVAGAFAAGEVWVGGREYVARDAQFIAPTYGLRPGVRRYNGAVDGQALFLSYKDRQVAYRVELAEEMAEAWLALRYMIPCGDEDQPLILSVDDRACEVGLPVDGRFATGDRLEDWRVCEWRVGGLAAGVHEVKIAPRADWRERRPAHVVINGMLISARRRDWEKEAPWRLVEGGGEGVFVERHIEKGALVLRNDNLRGGKYFALAGKGGRVSLRVFEVSDVAEGFSAVGPYWWCHGTYACAETIGEKSIMPGQGEDIGVVSASDARWANLSHADLWVRPGREEECWCVAVRDENKEDALRRAEEILKDPERHVRPRRELFARKAYRAPGEKYGPMMEHYVSNAIMCSTYTGALTGKATKTAGHFPLNNQPYLWDTGFQAIGMAPYSPKLALEMANLFLPATDEDPPAILYGTAVFSNIYAIWEVFQQTADVAVLAHFYPKMRKTYLWLTQRGEGAVFDPLGLDAIGGHRQSYCPIGADDYPANAQTCAFGDHDIEIHPWARNAYLYGDREKTTRGEEWYSDDVAMSGQTAHAIRYALTLRNAAELLGETGDIPRYERDIARFNKVLQERMWDEESGYYAWTKGREYRKVVDRTGQNFNMGFDGVMPLITCLCPHDRIARMLQNLASEQHLWTPFGLTNVDRSASYYEADGYWNGSIWHPHQWFLWKALIDVDLALARKVAFANLEKALRGHEKDLRLCEFYRASDGEGKPCEFASLNGPLCAWNAAYHEEGRLTVGYDTILHRRRYDPEAPRLTAELSAPHARAEIGVIACVKPSRRYRVSVSGERVASSQTGDLSFRLQAPRERMEISIAPE
ncbi:MAG: hypothetical protein V2A58_09005 [Planctomycetota bacterium]